MKKIIICFLFLVVGAGLAIFIYGCAESKMIAEKSGSQLWGENCIRCHNIPSSLEYSSAEWEVIGMHMKLRANLTDDETNKIVTFLKSEN